jgi:hypothetical protein
MPLVDLKQPTVRLAEGYGRPERDHKRLPTLSCCVLVPAYFHVMSIPTSAGGRRNLAARITVTSPTTGSYQGELAYVPYHPWSPCRRDRNNENW